MYQVTIVLKTAQISMGMSSNKLPMDILRESDLECSFVLPNRKARENSRIYGIG